MEKQAEIQISYVELEAGFYVHLYLQKPDKKGIKSPFICSFLTALSLLFQH